MHFCYKDTGSTVPPPYHFRILCMTVRKSPAVSPAVFNLDTLFQSGNTSFGPQGHVGDMYAHINEQQWFVYYDKVIKLGTALSAATNISFATNDHMNNVVVRFSLSKWFKKFVYDDALNSNSPIGALPYVCVLGDVSTGATGTANAALSAQVFIDNQWKYTDA